MQKGDFGTIYTQFEKKPKEAIKFLMKVKEGEAVKALFRDDIGFIDIIWGENDKDNKGFGLKHIVEKHGKEIKELGFDVETFIPIVVMYGELRIKANDPKKVILESKMFRVVITKEWFGKNKIMLLSAFDLRPINKKK